MYRVLIEVPGIWKTLRKLSLRGFIIPTRMKEFWEPVLAGNVVGMGQE